MALSFMLGLIVLFVSGFTRGRVLPWVGLLLLLLPVGCLLNDARLTEKNNAEAQAEFQDRQFHQRAMEAFCSDAPQRVELLATGGMIVDRPVALRLKCSRDDTVDSCKQMARELAGAFSSPSGDGCRISSVGAIYDEVLDEKLPCCKPLTSELQPVCGSTSKEPSSYDAYRLTTRLVSSVAHEGPQAVAHFSRIELTLEDSATAKPLARTFFFRIEPLRLDGTSIACRSFWTALGELTATTGRQPAP